MKRLAVVTILTLALLGCKDRSPQNASQSNATSASTSTGTSPTQTIFHVRGVVKELFPGKKKVSIHHEEIPDYMDPMTMTFDVKSTNELAGLQVGDQVAFRMIIEPRDGWIDQIKKVDGSVPPVLAPDTFRRVKEVDPLNVGDPVPNYRFTNELGKTVELRDFKGKALALTFIFTRCPFPTFCPKMTINFDEAQKQLKAMPNAPTNWHLLTLTFDPEYDTPTILKGYAARYKADPAHWSFLTGELIDITAISEQFGLTFWKPDPNQPAGINHNLRTVVIDKEGRVQKIFSQNEWKVEELVGEIVQAATNAAPKQAASAQPAAN